MKAKRLLFLVMAICLASGVRAQFNSEILFFHYCENSLGNTDVKPLSNPEAIILICRFKNGKVYCPKSQEYSQPLQDYLARGVRENLSSNINYYENKEWTEVSSGFIGYYDSNMSNNKWIVFKLDCPEIVDDMWGLNNPKHNQYYAWKKDYSEFMYWHEPDVWRTGRHIYKRCMKQDILTKTSSSKREFLK